MKSGVTTRETVPTFGRMPQILPVSNRSGRLWSIKRHPGSIVPLVIQRVSSVKDLFDIAHESNEPTSPAEDMVRHFSIAQKLGYFTSDTETLNKLVTHVCKQYQQPLEANMELVFVDASGNVASQNERRFCWGCPIQTRMADVQRCQNVSDENWEPGSKPSPENIGHNFLFTNGALIRSLTPTMERDEENPPSRFWTMVSRHRFFF